MTAATALRAALLAAVLAVTGPLAAGRPALAQTARPVPSFGESCPAGYSAHQRMCVPGEGARPVIPREGNCPPGWFATANWCARGNNAPDAQIRRAGMCQDGWRVVGDYCVRGR